MAGSTNENSFGKGMLHELTGQATRDQTSAFNLENVLFGTLGHIAIGVAGMAIFMKATGKKGPAFISGIIKPALAFGAPAASSAPSTGAAV